MGETIQGGHQTLVRQVAQGEGEAFGDLYDAFAPRVYGLALKMTRSQAAAEEITQDVFLRIWRGADQYRPERGSVTSWVLATARHRTIDWLRQKRRRRDDRDLLSLLDQEVAAAPVADPASDATRRLLVEDVRDAMAEMSQAQHQVLELAYFRGLTHPEISETLDIPLGTVKSRLHRGLKHLRRRLQPSETSGTTSKGGAAR